MEKIKRLTPEDIFDLWETDAGKICFSDIFGLDGIRFTVHFHDDGSGFDHTSSAEIDGAFFMQMPRAAYLDWAKKAAHDPRYSVSGLKDDDEMRARLSAGPYDYAISRAMNFLSYDMDASIFARNAKEINGIAQNLTFSDLIEKYIDEDARILWGWVPDALIRHKDAPSVKAVERKFWLAVESSRSNENFEDFLRATVASFAPRAGKALSKYIVSSLDEEEMETFCKYLRKIGCASSSDHAEIALQDVCFTCPDQIVGAWYKAQRDTDLFHLPRGFGHRKSEVISNG